ncbi:MAG: diguanylate phosphodiesterase [Spirulina sp. SIO3F2]|nr:diguanylate phosphodiesterase [Spirulina sp. SIO3F2]
MQDADLVSLLETSRKNNAKAKITGILLHENGSFFQVLEGTQEAVEQLYERILHDNRHTKVVTIIREPIAKRTFGEWTMGFVKLDSQELDEIIGLNDFFAEGSSFTQLGAGRAKKLLAAFRKGRWRSKVKNQSPVQQKDGEKEVSLKSATSHISKISFAFQPIVDVEEHRVIAYEALIRGQKNEDFSNIVPEISEQEWLQFDTSCRAIAISTAARLGLPSDLHLNFMARQVKDARSAIQSTLEAAERNGINLNRIVLEIDQDKLIGDSQHFAQIIEEYRGVGLRVSIDHFGAGRAALKLLEILRPDMIALNIQIVRDIDTNGARQAIVRGVTQTCDDLGIDIVAKDVNSVEEYQWFLDEGITLIQGNLIASPAFEQFPAPQYL